MLTCTSCRASGVGTGLDGRIYCQDCRDWKADRQRRVEAAGIHYPSYPKRITRAIVPHVQRTEQ